MITTALLAATAVFLGVALVVGALAWRGELRARLAAARTDHDRDIAEWRDEVARLTDVCQRQQTRIRHQKARILGYLQELDALTAARPSVPTADDGGWQMAQDVLADLRALPVTDGEDRR